MKKINTITQIALALVLITIFSCSNNNKKNIQVEIPTELQNNAEVVSYINEMTKATNKANGLFNDIVKITGGKDINNSDELTTMQTLKMAKAAGQLMMVSSKMEEFKIQRKSIDSLLTPNQIIALDKVCKELENSMAQIAPENITIDTTEMLAQQKIQKEQNAEVEKQREEWEQAQIEQAQIEGQEYQPETEKQENSEFVWWHLLFPIGVVSLFIFGGIMLFKILKNKVKNIGYAMGEMKDKVQEAKEMTDKKGPNGKEMTAEEKNGLDLLNDLLNKNK